MNTPHNDVALKRYLLGELFGTELDELERQYLADSGLFAQLLVVEDELIDEYASGELNQTERAQFERQVLATPGLRERLLNAKALLAVARTTQRSVPLNRQQTLTGKWKLWVGVMGQRSALAFATLVVLLIGGGIAVRLWQRNTELKRIEAQRRLSPSQPPEAAVTLQAQQGNEKQQLPGKAESPPTITARAPQVVTFILPMVVTRGESATTFALKPGIETVRLHVQIPGADYKTYRVELQSADGEHIQSFKKMKPQRTSNGDVLILNVPARSLIRSDYTVKLTGVIGDGHLEDAGSYSFRVIKE